MTNYDDLAGNILIGWAATCIVATYLYCLWGSRRHKRREAERRAREQAVEDFLTDLFTQEPRHLTREEVDLVTWEREFMDRGQR